MDKTYTVKEVAELLKVNPNTVYRWIEKGHITGVKIGKRKIFIPAVEINKITGGC